MSERATPEATDEEPTPTDADRADGSTATQPEATEAGRAQTAEERAESRPVTSGADSVVRAL